MSTQDALLDASECLPLQSDEDLFSQMQEVNRMASERSALRAHLGHRCGNSSDPFDREQFAADYRAHISAFMRLRAEAAALASK